MDASTGKACTRNCHKENEMSTKTGKRFHSFIIQKTNKQTKAYFFRCCLSLSLRKYMSIIPSFKSATKKAGISEIFIKHPQFYFLLITLRNESQTPTNFDIFIIIIKLQSTHKSFSLIVIFLEENSRMFKCKFISDQRITAQQYACFREGREERGGREGEGEEGEGGGEREGGKEEEERG